MRKDSAELLNIYRENVSLILSQRTYGYLSGMYALRKRETWRSSNDYLSVEMEMILISDLNHYYGLLVKWGTLEGRRSMDFRSKSLS